MGLFGAAAAMPAAPAPYHAPAPAPYHAPVHHEKEYAPAPFAFQYGVADDYSKANFPTDVSKLSPTPLTTTTDSSLMSNTKEPQYTQKLSHTTQLQPQLTTLPQSTTSKPTPTLKKLTLKVSVYL